MKTTKTQGYEHSLHFAATQAEKVLAYITANPGQTREEISQGCGLQKSSCTARIKSLIDDGMIHVSGVKPGKHGILNETLSALPSLAPIIPKKQFVKISLQALTAIFDQVEDLTNQLNELKNGIKK